MTQKTKSVEITRGEAFILRNYAAESLGMAYVDYAHRPELHDIIDMRKEIFLRWDKVWKSFID